MPAVATDRPKSNLPAAIASAAAVEPKPRETVTLRPCLAQKPLDLATKAMRLLPSASHGSVKVRSVAARATNGVANPATRPAAPAVDLSALRRVMICLVDMARSPRAGVELFGCGWAVALVVGRRPPCMLGDEAAPGGDAGVGARQGFALALHALQHALVLVGEQPIVRPRQPENPLQAIAQCREGPAPGEAAEGVEERRGRIDGHDPAAHEVVAARPADQGYAGQQRALAVQVAVLHDGRRLGGVDVLAAAGRLQAAVPGLPLRRELAEAGIRRLADAAACLVADAASVGGRLGRELHGMREDRS